MTEMNDSNKKEEFEKIFNYKFHNFELRTRAMTSKAWLNEKDPNKLLIYPGLATLGDSVISLCMVHQYCLMNKEKGEITIEKSKRVRRKNHTRIAHKIGLMDCIYLGMGEGKQEKWKIGAAPGEFLESILGAIFLDVMFENGKGIEVCSNILKHIELME